MSWGLETPNFSNGAVYADLDNDGDLDLVINNINDEASLYQNNLRENKKDSSHYLQISFVGDKNNIDGIGAAVDIYYDKGKIQTWDNTPYRGYLSTIQDIAHFGLGTVTLIDSIVVKWPDHKKQVLKNVKADQLLEVKISQANMQYGNWRKRR
jgi:hypothetical protein